MEEGNDNRIDKKWKRNTGERMQWKKYEKDTGNLEGNYNAQQI